MSGIRVELTLSDGSFASGLLRAGQSLDSFNRELMRLDPNFRRVMTTQGGFIRSSERVNANSRTLLSTMRDLSIVGGALALAFSAVTGSGGGLIGSIVKINADMDRLKFMMSSMSTASDPMREAAENVDYLRRKATEVPFSLKEISTSFAKLKATGTDPMAGSLDALADGIAAFGGTDEQLHRVTLGITQMSGKSVIQMEEMRQQLGESMPNAMSIMSRSMGVSIAELTSAISTGRVQAKPALEAFYAELNRTYGGAAQRMMNTFSGQVTQLQANLQQLATGTGLKNFVDVTLKDLIKEFNGFLQTDQARAFADGFGSALSTVATSTANVLKTLYKFREELLFIGKMLAAGIGIRLLAGAFAGVQLAIAATKLSLIGLNVGLVGVAAQFNMMMIRARSGAGALLVFSAAARTVGASMLVMGTAFVAFAPLILALGTAVAIAGGHFGIFKNKVAEAYDGLREFGAESRAQASELSKDREQQIRDNIASLIEQRDAETRLSKSPFMGGSGNVQEQGIRNEFSEKIRIQNELLAEVLGERPDLITKSGERERAARNAVFGRAIDQTNEAAQQEYNRVVIAASDRMTAELEIMETTGRARLSINDEYQAALRDARIKLSEEELKTLTDLAAKQNAILSNPISTQVETEGANDSLGFITERLKSVNAELLAARDIKFGINLGPEIEDVSAKMARGAKILNDMEDEIAGIEASLSGAGDDYAILLAKINRGDFGTFEEGGQAVLDIIDNLMEAATRKEKLDRLLKARVDGRRNLDSTTEDIAGIEAEIAGTGNAVATLQYQIDRGDYGTFAEGGQAVLDLHENMLTAAKSKERLDRILKGGDAGRKTLEGLQKDAIGLKASLSGASSATAEMLEMIRRGDFGSIEEGGDSVRRLHEALLDATRQKEALDELMEGQNRAEADLERARTNVIEKQLELKERAMGRELTEGERIQMRLDEGIYAGLGPIENIRRALQGVIGAIDIQGDAANRAGEVLRNNTFGAQTIQRIDDTTAAMERLVNSVSGLGSMLQGVDFASFGSSMPKGGMIINHNFGGDIKDLIGAAEGTDKGRGYNETLGYGAFTGGDVTLVNKTLNEILAIQKSMLSHPNNSFNSSALGRYQIVSKTLRGLMKEMGLTGGEMFSPQMQDAMADRLLARRGANVDGLRNEWEGLRRVDPKVILDTFARSLNTNTKGMDPFKYNTIKPTVQDTTTSNAISVPPVYDASISNAKLLEMEANRVRKTQELAAAAAAIAERERANQSLEQQQNASDYLDDLLRKTEAAGLSTEELGKNHAALIEAIKSGSLLSSRDVDDPAYVNLIAQAKELDRIEAESGKRREAARDYERESLSFEREKAEVAKKIADERARADNPDYVAESSAIQGLIRDMDKLAESARLAFGEDSEQYKQALSAKSSALQQLRLSEATSRRADLEAEKRDIQDSLLSETQLRSVNLQRKMAEIDSVAEAMRQAGESEIEITRWVEEQKAVIRAQHNAEASPMSKMLGQWMDLQGQLTQKTAEWTDSLATGVAGLITGTGTLKSSVQGIIGDISQMAVKYMIAQSKQGKTGPKASKGGLFGFIGKSIMGSVGVPAVHTGGIASSSRLKQRRVAPDVFANSKRFHVGGMMKNITGGDVKGLAKGERPIIVMDSEGVFTTEQMANMAPLNASKFHSDQLSAMASPSLFSNAAKFHTGGIVGKGLRANEMPQISQSGSPLTPDQTRDFGAGMSSFKIDAPITVNGSAGTPDQNADLARKMAKQFEETMRGTVITELQRQMRPGNMLSKR